MAVVRYRTTAVLRRHWRATVVAALAVGVVAAVTMSTWAAGRRGSDAYDRFMRAVDRPAVTLWFCDPTVTKEQVATSGGFCPRAYDSAAEQAFVAKLPGVRSVSVTHWYFSQVQVGRQHFTGAFLSTIGGGLVSEQGRPIVVSGHLPTKPDELAVNEAGASSVSPPAHLGETVQMLPIDVGSGQPIEASPEPFHLSGIVRFPLDLAAEVRDPELTDGVAFVAPSWYAARGDRLASLGDEVQVRLSPGASAQDVYRAVAREWSNRYVNTIDNHDAAASTVRSAIDYEATALKSLAVALALASMIFVGQALSRQARWEQDDLPALRGLGLTRGQAASAAAMRAVPVAAGAAVVAVALAWVSTRWTPIGLASRAEPDPGFRADIAVAVLGAAATFLFTVACLTLPTIRLRRSATRPPVNGTRVAGAVGLPAPAITGVAMATARRRGALSLGTALIGLTLATAVVVAAAMVGVSLRQLAHDPARYGVRWDATVSYEGESGPLEQSLAAARDVTAAGMVLENNGRVDGQVTNVVAITGVKGSDASAWTSIVAGRAPERDDQAALGGRTMRSLRAHVGSTIVVQVSDAVAPVRLRVVGQAVFNDAQKLDAGDGALVRPAVMQSTQGASFDVLDVRVRPGVPLASALRPFQQSGGRWDRPTPPTSVRNLQRIAWLPWALAVAVAVLAFAALAHALGMSVRSNRRELAVLRSLGFTPSQVRRAAGWEAALLALAAHVAGIPLGLLLGTSGWGVLMRGIGLGDPATVPAIALPVVLAAVVTVAVALSVWPGRHAARARPASALRSE